MRKHLSVCLDTNFKKRDDIRGKGQIREWKTYWTAHASHKLKGDYDGRHDNPLKPIFTFDADAGKRKG